MVCVGEKTLCDAARLPAAFGRHDAAAHTGNKFTSILVSDHKMFMTSQVRQHFYKVKISQRKHISRITDALDEHVDPRIEEIEIVMHAKDKLFRAVWRNIWERLEDNNYQKFVVHDTADGVHERNRIAVDGTEFSAKFFDFFDFDTLPLGVESAKLYVDSAYQRRPDDVRKLARWLTRRKSLRHLEIDERIGVLALAMDRAKRKREDKSGNYDYVLAKLETVEARLYEETMSLSFLFMLPSTHILTFLVDKVDKVHAFIQEGKPHGWIQEYSKEYDSLLYVQYVNKDRQPQSSGSSWRSSSSSQSVSTRGSRTSQNSRNSRPPTP